MKIFVVEDNEKIAQSLRTGLASEGAVVELSYDGQDALEALLRAQKTPDGGGFDAVILDLMLPGLDGVSLCRRLRKAGLTLPILMLTAKNQVADRVAGLDAGADDYLAKPFAFEELLARLRALLRRPPMALPNAVLRRGQVELDPLTLKARVRGVDVGLTVKEFRLLELFVRHPGQVFTRDQLVRDLWDFAFEGSSNVVDVHVKNLRKKLELRGPQGGNDDGISTVRGVGYRFQG